MSMKTSLIKTLRVANGISQNNLGEEVGLSQPRISRIETGKFAIRPVEAERIARVLGVTPELVICDLTTAMPEAKPE